MELNTWLSVRGWRPNTAEPPDDDSVEEWINARQAGYIKLTKQLFDESGRLIPFSADQWDDAWVEFVAPPDPKVDDDDLPF